MIRSFQEVRFRSCAALPPRRPRFRPTPAGRGPGPSSESAGVPRSSSSRGARFREGTFARVGRQFRPGGEGVKEARDDRLLDLRAVKSRALPGQPRHVEFRRIAIPPRDVDAEDFGPFLLGGQVDEEDLVQAALAQQLRRQVRDVVGRRNDKDRRRSSRKAKSGRCRTRGPPCRRRSRRSREPEKALSISSTQRIAGATDSAMRMARRTFSSLDPTRLPNMRPMSNRSSGSFHKPADRLRAQSTCRSPARPGAAAPAARAARNPRPGR